jgi:hypothetical protein
MNEIKACVKEVWYSIGFTFPYAFCQMMAKLPSSPEDASLMKSPSALNLDFSGSKIIKNKFLFL